MVAGSCRKHSKSGPSSSKDPRSRSVEICPVTCSSLDVVPGSRKVTHQWEPVRLSGGDWAWWPSSGRALQHLQLHPWDLLLGQSQFWEWWQTSSPILVVDWLSLSMHSSSMVAAARACQWVSLALASSNSPKVSCLPLWEAWSQWQDRWVPGGSSYPPPPDCSPLLHLRQSFKEDTMSFVISCALSDPHSGCPGNFLSMYTWW